MNEEILRLMMGQHTGGDKCQVISPEGQYGCTMRKGHEGDCRNMSTNMSWCGWCGAWLCKKPEVHAEKTS